MAHEIASLGGGFVRRLPRSRWRTAGSTFRSADQERPRHGRHGQSVVPGRHRRSERSHRGDRKARRRAGRARDRRRRQVRRAWIHRHSFARRRWIRTARGIPRSGSGSPLGAEPRLARHHHRGRQPGRPLAVAGRRSARAAREDRHRPERDAARRPRHGPPQRDGRRCAAAGEGR